MGMESFSNVPTKESITSAIEQVKKQLKIQEEQLETAKNTPVSHMFREEVKNSAIADFERVIANSNAEIEKYEQELARLEG